MTFYRKIPYVSRLTPETQLHIECADFLNTQPDRWRYHHSPNEGKRSYFQQYLIKKMGVSSGFPDFIIFSKKNEHSPFAIEIKVGTNVPSKNQEDWLKFFYEYTNIVPYCVWSLDSFVKIVEHGYEETMLIDKSYWVLTEDNLPPKIIKKLKFL